MDRMANKAYLSVWCKDFPEDRILERCGTFLSTIPLSTIRPGYAYLTIRAVDISEPAILEQDLRSVPLGPLEIMEIAQDHVHSDCSLELTCYWDLGTFDASNGKSSVEPQALEVTCRGEDYDSGFWEEGGHLAVDLGFEHSFTGHGGLLGVRAAPDAPSESIEEARFYEAMVWPDNLEKYQAKTRENVRKLFEWVGRVERALPVERLRLWSEGEEDFQARLQEIVAAR
jgi:hypothetical protein